MSVDRIVFTTAESVSVIVCLPAAILVFWLKLHKKVVYRLAFYQVLASLAFATVSILQVILINYDKNPEVYGRVCTALGWLILYTFWMKLLFTMWVTFHLFFFTVFHKNLKKLEVLYVVTSQLIPALIASVPLITNTYGIGPLHVTCLIFDQNDTNHIASIERFALFDSPAMVILMTASIAMVVMVIKLAHRVCWRLKYEPIIDGDQYWKALKQLLPLAAFPILFSIFMIPRLIYDIYSARVPVLAIAPGLAVLVSTSIWSMASGVILIVHISVACPCRDRKLQHKENMPCSGSCTVRVTSQISVNSSTHFSLPNEF